MGKMKEAGLLDFEGQGTKGGDDSEWEGSDLRAAWKKATGHVRKVAEMKC